MCVDSRRVDAIDGLTLSFLYNPVVDFDLTHHSEILEQLPLIKSRLMSLVSDFVAQWMVLPNRLALALRNNADLTLLRHPPPVGVVRVTLAQIGVVVAASTKHLLTRSRARLWATLKVGAKESTVKLGDNNDAEIWSRVEEFIVDEVGGQMLEVGVWTKVVCFFFLVRLLVFCFGLEYIPPGHKHSALVVNATSARPHLVSKS